MKKCDRPFHEVHNLNFLWVLILLPCLLYSCFDKPKEESREWIDLVLQNYTSGLTAEQESAFDALNALQISSDTKDHLYSTFAGLRRPCYPADTTFLLTQAELLTAMTAFGEQHYTNLDKAERNDLIATAVLAQKQYTVFHCVDEDVTLNYDQGPSMVGKWIMPAVLGRRDVVLVW